MVHLIESTVKLLVTPVYAFTNSKEKNFSWTRLDKEPNDNPIWFYPNPPDIIGVVVGEGDLISLSLSVENDFQAERIIEKLSIPSGYKFLSKMTDPTNPIVGSTTVFLRVYGLQRSSDPLIGSPSFKLNEGGFLSIKTEGYVPLAGAAKGRIYTLKNGDFTPDDRIHELDYQVLISIIDSLADTTEYRRRLKLDGEEKIAQQAKAEVEVESIETPFIPHSVFKKLPDSITKYLKQYKLPRERDLSLLSALAVISACLPNVTARHVSKKVWAHIYVMIIAPPASGKGVAFDSIVFIQEIEKRLKQEFELAYSNYKRNIELFKAKEIAEAPEIPRYSTIQLPTDTSFIALFRQLDNNNGSGLMLETELDTFINAGKQEWGNYSVLNRKATHHESHTVNRKEFEKPITIDEPKIAMLMTGTPDQFFNLFDSVENGLFSRFLIYFYKLKEITLLNPYQKTGFEDIDSLRKEISKTFAELYFNLKDRKSEIEFSWTEDQAELLYKHFSKSLKEVFSVYGDSAASILLRYMLLATRIGMVISTIKAYEEGELKSTNLIVASDETCNVVLDIIKTCMQHSLLMLANIEALGKRKPITVKGHNTLKLLMTLPDKRSFKTKEAVSIGRELKISERSVYNYLDDLVKAKQLERVSQGEYRKLK